MTSRERVLSALNHVQPDAVPCDFFATPEILAALLEHFGARGNDELLERLGTDVRYVEPVYAGPPLPVDSDGSFVNFWGILRKPVRNEYGDYAEPSGLAYSFDSIEQAEQFPWPKADWFDYSTIAAQAAKHPDKAVACGAFSVQDFINGVAYGRGVEQVLVDIALRDPIFMYLAERRQRFYMDFIERILDAAGGRIDYVLCGDDLGTQRGLLISPETFDELFAGWKKELFDLAHSRGAKIVHHSCGSTRALIPRFIELGMDCLQTIQPRAAGMDPYGLKRDFAGRLAFHGAVDAQGFLQAARPQEVRREVDRLMDEVGRGGGYIAGPSHNIQPDTPIENVLALYETVAERRR